MNYKYALTLLGLVSSLVMAQDYPHKPIRIVVPYPPGGVSDVATRLVAPKMSEILGQPIIIEISIIGICFERASCLI